jgi:8-oxo-dGTP diphosphatase
MARKEDRDIHSDSSWTGTCTVTDSTTGHPSAPRDPKDWASICAVLSGSRRGLSPGSGTLRGVASSEAVQVAVWVWIESGSVLAVKPSGVGPWFLPGGLVEPGETPAESVVREVHEETGLGLDLTSLREVGMVRGPAHGRPGVDAAMWVFAGSGSGVPAPQPPEIEELRWLPLDELGTMAPLAADAVRLASEAELALPK